MTTLGDITFPKIDQSGPPKVGEFTYIDISGVDNKAKRIFDPKRLPAECAPSRARQRLMAGDVLVSMTRPNLNAVALVPPELDGAIGSTGFHVLRANEGTEPRWLYYAVQNRSFVQAMSEVVQGALYPAVRPKDIKAFKIDPPLLDQQRSIVSEIEKQFSRLDEAFTDLQHVKANLKRYKAAVLQSAVEGRLVPTEAELARRKARSYETGGQLLQRILEIHRRQWKGKSKYVEPVVPNTANLPVLPEGWVWATLDQLAVETQIGLIRGRDQQNTEGFGVPYVKMNNVSLDGEVDLSALIHVEANESDRKRYALRDGDLLFNTRNSKELVGKTGLVRNPPIGTIYNNNLMRIRLADGVLPQFLIVQICSHEFRNRLELAKKATTNVAAVYAKDLFPLQLALPPQKEQARIVAETDRLLSLAREVEFEVEANLKRAEVLRQSCLSSAFGAIPQENAL